MHCFQLSRETWSGVLCSETLIRRICEDLFLKATRITCSIRRDQSWRKKSFTSSPSISALVNFNDKQNSKDWRYRTHNTDLWSLDENKFDYKNKWLWKKKVFETLRFGENTRWEKWRELKNNELTSSQCKSWEKIIWQFSSSLHNCSKCKSRWILWMILEIFKMWNQIVVEGCLTFPVNLWWFRVLVLYSAATKDCCLTHGINLDYRNTFWEINFLRLLFSENSNWRRAEKPRSRHWSRKDEDRSHKLRLTKSRHNSNADINKKSVDYEFYNTAGITAELRGRTAKTANIGIAIRQIPKSTVVHGLGVKNSIQNTNHYLFWFSIGCHVVDQRSGDGWFFGRIKILTISIWKDFFKFRDTGREDCLCSEQDHPEFPVEEEGQVSLEQQKVHKEDQFLRGRHIAFMIYDYFRVTFDTRWDEVLLSMSKIPSDDILESLYKLRTSESNELEMVLELYDTDNHQKISMPNHQKKWRRWWRKVLTRNFDCETLTPGMG